ncbi:dienelactone hydrolase family protein [Catellatospora tritici]|uniref:dienelactone hydrolase family protein n=1 Tax=Catellatospora tritici TaxID=2851566 RepID=UPI001C2D5034|nr:dienelactone hydrolase family protein [Catellatospora tritici]MBV1851682.1 dienelactone hydrolase family protein [Catellatospora tritici]
MTGFEGYLRDEVVTDYADGLIDRREALRRLGLLGIGAAVAAPMLAACDAQRGAAGDPTLTPTADAGATPVAAPSNQPAGPTPLPTQEITFAGPDGRQLKGAWAAAGQPHGTVLVIHENKGLTPHLASVAGRLAASGFSALAIDLLSEEGGTASFTDPAQATAALNAAPMERKLGDLKAGVDELLRREPQRKPGAVGFCFGGGMTWSLLASGEPRLYAAAPFYGPFPEGADLAGSPHAAVLAVYGERDARVNATRDQAEQALRAAGLTHRVVTYPGADHAFFNDTGPRYDPAAAAQAYTQLTGWFGAHLG